MVDQFPAMHTHPGTLVPVIIQDIMISFDQFHFQRRKIFTPFDKKIEFFIGRTVGKVTHNDQPVHFVEVELGDQPLQIRFIDTLGNSDTCFPEMPGLTKVQVRNNEGIRIFPVKAAFGRNPEGLTVNDMGDRVLQFKGSANLWQAIHFFPAYLNFTSWRESGA